MTDRTLEGDTPPQFFGGSLRLRRRAVETVRELVGDPNILVFPQSRASFQSGLELYAARPDKGYSLTDCISMQTMRRERLTDVLTNDKHFEQEGFRSLFRDDPWSGAEGKSTPAL